MEKNVDREFEYALAWHCAPSLWGLKPADLICCPDREDWREVLGYYANILALRGVRMRVLGHSGKGMLLLIYRPGQLDDCLKEPAAAQMLARAGYPQGAGTHALLCHLSTRLAARGFPHEIGLFLGYPPEDVAGFCRDGGRGCRYSGAWKVYGDVEQAKRRFGAYHRCRAAMTGRLNRGEGLEQVLPA